MRRTRWVEGVGALVAASMVALTVGGTLPAQASLLHPAVVSENPADTTPHIVLSDTSFDVRAFAQVGRTVYAGGLFNQVQDWARTTTYPRQNFVAFDSETGVISPLNLAFDGTVGAIEATADGTALFIGAPSRTSTGSLAGESSSTTWSTIGSTRPSRRRACERCTTSSSSPTVLSLRRETSRSR